MVTIPLKQSHSASVALYQNDVYKQLDTAIEELNIAEEAWRQLVITDILEKNLDKLNRIYELVTSNEELDETTKILAMANIKSVNEDLNLGLEFSNDVVATQEGLIDAIGSVFKALINGIVKLVDFIVNLITKTIEWLGNLFGGKTNKGGGGGSSLGSSSTKESTKAVIKKLDEIEERIKKITLHMLSRDGNETITKEVGKIFNHLRKLEGNIEYMSVVKELINVDVVKNLRSVIEEYINEAMKDIETKLDIRKKNFEEICSLKEAENVTDEEFSKIKEKILKNMNTIIVESAKPILIAKIIKDDYVFKLFKDPNLLENLKKSKPVEGYTVKIENIVMGIEISYEDKKKNFYYTKIAKLSASGAYKFSINTNIDFKSFNFKLERVETVPVEIVAKDTTLSDMIRNKFDTYALDDGGVTLKKLKDIMLKLEQEWITYFNLTIANVKKFNKDLKTIGEKLNSLKSDVEDIQKKIKNCDLKDIKNIDGLPVLYKTLLDIAKLDLITIVDIIKNLKTFMKIVKVAYYDPFINIESIKDSLYKINNALRKEIEDTAKK